MRARWLRSLLLVAVIAGAAGCSSDSIDPPEASLQTPGAFIAQEQDPGNVRLMRTIAALTAENGEIVLFVTLYEPHVANFEQATELAKQRQIPIQQLLSPAVKSELEQVPVQVVWFRSLEQWEEELVN